MGAVPDSVLIIQHGPGGPSSPVADALRARGLDVRVCAAFAGDRPPADMDGYRGLVVAGGVDTAASLLLEQARAAGLPLLEISEPISTQRLDAFAELVANSPAYRSVQGTRAFFAARAATWEEKFPDDGPVFTAAIAEMALVAGDEVLDAGCGTGRAIPLLSEAVAPSGHVIGADLTPEMIQSARERGRGAYGHLLVADVARLPLPDARLDAVFAAGLISHLPDPAAVLSELARVTVPGGRLALFHPVGRAVLAARHGRSLTSSDVRAEKNLRPLLEGTGWSLAGYHDTDERYLALATRTSGPTR